jgi:hypothetical protein
MYKVSKIFTFKSLGFLAFLKMLDNIRRPCYYFICEYLICILTVKVIAMNTSDIVRQVTDGFANTYSHFKEFQQSSEYRAYWDKCIECISDRDLLNNIIFCNDVFAIPPVKTFLTYYRDDFILLTGNKQAQLDTFVKRSIGAFWGMVFKFVLGYTEQKSASISMNEYFMVKTASVYSGVKSPRDIDLYAP